MAVQVGGSSSEVVRTKSRRRVNLALIVIYTYLGLSAVCFVSYMVIRIAEIPEGIRVFIPLGMVLLLVLIAGICRLRDMAKEKDW